MLQKWITAPPPRAKYFSDDDEILLEDDSGRVKLVGDRIKNLNLVTGQSTALLVFFLHLSMLTADHLILITFCHPQESSSPSWDTRRNRETSKSSTSALEESLLTPNPRPLLPRRSRSWMIWTLTMVSCSLPLSSWVLLLALAGFTSGGRKGSR